MDEQVQAPQAEDKMYKCAKCGKEKSKDHGVFMMEGTAFCCEDCCKKEDHKEGDNVCEFC